MSITPFHLATFTNDLNATRAFFQDVLQCKKGREAPTWVDFDFFGHQLSLHKGEPQLGPTGTVDAHAVPMPHFGAVLEWNIWHELIERLKVNNIAFVLEPQMRFEGQAGEQGTFFVMAPGGIALEFKTFKDKAMIFAS